MKGVAVQFFENEIYTVDDVAKILSRCPQSVRKMCKDGLIAARMDRGGYHITGWAIRAYAENRRLCADSADLSLSKKMH